MNKADTFKALSEPTSGDCDNCKHDVNAVWDWKKGGEVDMPSNRCMVCLLDPDGYIHWEWNGEK